MLHRLAHKGVVVEAGAVEVHREVLVHVVVEAPLSCVAVAVEVRSAEDSRRGGEVEVVPTERAYLDIMLSSNSSHQGGGAGEPRVVGGARGRPSSSAFLRVSSKKATCVGDVGGSRGCCYDRQSSLEDSVVARPSGSDCSATAAS